MQARIYLEIAARRRDSAGELLRVGVRFLCSQTAQPGPGADARLIARIKRMDHLTEFELVGETGVDYLDSAHRVDIVADIAETVVILLEGVAQLQGTRLGHRQCIVGSELGGAVILMETQVVVERG